MPMHFSAQAAEGDREDRRVTAATALAMREAPLKLKIDLHEIYNRGAEIDAALVRIIEEAVRTKASQVEIITGKGSGQLKKRVLRFLDQPEIKARYHRVEKDSHNFGRVFVHFKKR
jgi:DNA-nicking Smr family endonuclease